MKKMFSLIPVTAFFLQFEIAASAQIIYQNDFSKTQNPARSWRTVGEDEFTQVWSVTSSVQTPAGNKYARYELNVPSLPTNPDARWDGGFWGYPSTNAALPAEWQLSFDILPYNLEPFQVRFRLGVRPPEPSPRPGPVSLITYWVQPSVAGWQRIVIDQNTPYSQSESSSTIWGTSMFIAMASHDEYGNPLAISHVGTYDFSLDNVVFSAIPEPATFVFFGLGGLLFVANRACKRRSRY